MNIYIFFGPMICLVRLTICIYIYALYEYIHFFCPMICLVRLTICIYIYALYEYIHFFWSYDNFTFFPRAVIRDVFYLLFWRVFFFFPGNRECW